LRNQTSNTPPLSPNFICFLYIVLISLASYVVETTISVVTILLTTLLLENGMVHLSNLVVKEQGLNAPLILYFIWNWILIPHFQNMDFYRIVFYIVAIMVPIQNFSPNRRAFSAKWWMLAATLNLKLKYEKSYHFRGPQITTL